LDDARVFFEKGRQRQLLECSKARSGLTWEDYAAEIGASSYGVIRATYLNERNSLPLSMLRKITRHMEGDDWKSWIGSVRRRYWGQAKGGSVSLRLWHQRMRLDSRHYHELQSSRFLRSGNYKYLTSAGYEVRSLYELVLAENLIVNRIQHQYERMLRCGERILFPDFFVNCRSSIAIIEVCGFRSAQNLLRLRNKMCTYVSHGVADAVIILHLTEDELVVRTIADEFGRTVRLVSMNDIRSLFAILRRILGRPTTFQIITESEALKRCRQVKGKRFYWEHLLKRVPKESWIEVLATSGLRKSAVKGVRKVVDLRSRLIEATRLAIEQGYMPREALVEMIAGTYNGAAGHIFGSMANLVDIVESERTLERFT